MSKYYILQSLRDTDRKTGKEIYDYLKDNSDVFFKEFKTKKELEDLLEFIKVDSQTTTKKPFVHFDCHGNSEGIGIIKQDGEELIKWTELGDFFREIYLSSGKKSTLCLSSCEGFNAIKLVPEFKICPYEYVAGSFEKIGFDDSYNAFKEFYDQINAGVDIKPASYYIHNKYDKMKFICFSSNSLFELASKSYLNEKTSKEELEKQKQITINKLGQISNLNPQQIAFLEYAYSEQGQKDYIEKWRTIFFS